MVPGVPVGQQNSNRHRRGTWLVANVSSSTRSKLQPRTSTVVSLTTEINRKCKSLFVKLGDTRCSSVPVGKHSLCSHEYSYRCCRFFFPLNKAEPCTPSSEFICKFIFHNWYRFHARTGLLCDFCKCGINIHRNILAKPKSLNNHVNYQ
jgi:hypothetical protein